MGRCKNQGNIAMKYTHATIVVTNAVAVNLRKLSQMLDKGDCDGMFGAGLSATGNLPATHWISAGMVPKAYLNAITDPVRLFNVAKAAWEADSLVFPFTQPQVTNALGNCTITDGTYDDPAISPMTGLPVGVRQEEPLQLIARLGLQIVRTPI